MENDHDGEGSLENAYHDESQRNETSLVVLGRVSAHRDTGRCSQVNNKKFKEGGIYEWTTSWRITSLCPEEGDISYRGLSGTYLYVVPKS